MDCELAVSVLGALGLKVKQDCCQEDGVFCRNQRVVSIVLNQRQLSGAIPETIQSLSALTSLVITDSFLQGPIPSALGALENLETLYLSNNNLTGQIPRCLGKLKKLKFLKLDNNQLEGSIPASFGNLDNLRELHLNGNRLTFLPKELNNLTQLNRLYLNSNPLTGKMPRLWTNLTIDPQCSQGSVPSFNGMRYCCDLGNVCSDALRPTGCGEHVACPAGAANLLPVFFVIAILILLGAGYWLRKRRIRTNPIIIKVN